MGAVVSKAAKALRVAVAAAILSIGTVGYAMAGAPPVAEAASHHSAASQAMSYGVCPGCTDRPRLGDVNLKEGAR